MAIEAGDDVFVDDGEGIVGHVRRVNLREIVIYVEERGDFTLKRADVVPAGSNRVMLRCRQLPLKLRAMIGHLHGAEWAED